MSDDLFGSTRPENLPPPVKSTRKKRGFVTKASKAPCIPEDDPERFQQYLDSKRTANVDHTKRTIDLLENWGWRAYRVDVYNTFSGRRKDLLGFQDVQALVPDIPGVVAVQLTSKDHMTDRIKKACSLRECITWLECGNSFLVIGWFKGSNGRWLCAETWIDLAKAKEIYDKANP